MLPSTAKLDERDLIQGIQSVSGELAVKLVADRTGLEPATSGVTGRHSNRLNYRSTQTFLTLYKIDSADLCNATKWWVLRDLNPRHSPCKGDALPTELNTRSLG